VGQKPRRYQGSENALDVVQKFLLRYLTPNDASRSRGGVRPRGYKSQNPASISV